MKNKKLVRLKFNEDCLKRDKNKCVFCNLTSNLDVHHITDRNEMPNGGYVKENGITLCEVHHLEAEQFHTTNGEKWVANMHPNDLYKKINSNYELALEVSERSSR